MRASIKKLNLKFSFPAHTSRGTLFEKPSWFIFLEKDGFTSVGECSVIPGLSPEYDLHYEQKIIDFATSVNQGNMPGMQELNPYPSIHFGMETALLELHNREEGILFPSAFTRGNESIAINGLIWMGNKSEMMERIREKLTKGFKVLKMKVGSLDFAEELQLLKSIRSEYAAGDLEIRLDANGAYNPAEASDKLLRLSEMHIHSIEQPIKPGQWDEMARLAEMSPIPVALDEELIGLKTKEEKEKMMDTIRPPYIILKPGLLGGTEICNEWIYLAQIHNASWWATSALESNIGLNAIAQWVFTLKPTMIQGLGTGQVFTNNIPSPLNLQGDKLFYSPDLCWHRKQESMQVICA
jgi:o-succinylbenzoate synthase